MFACFTKHPSSTALALATGTTVKAGLLGT